MIAQFTRWLSPAESSSRCAHGLRAGQGNGFILIRDRAHLTPEYLESQAVRKVFLPHWSHMAVIAAVRPDIVYTHHSGDVNIDHRIAHDVVIAAVRPQPGNEVSGLYVFETPSSTEWRPPNSAASFMPTHYINISETLDHKMAALRIYASEMRPWPHSRSYQAIEHLARWRGATVGREAAEAFETGRSIA